MPLECGIHAVVEWEQLCWIFTDEVRCEFGDPSAGPRRIGGEIKGTEWTNLTVAGDAFVRFN